MLWTPQLQAALMRAVIGSIMAFLTTAGVTEALTNGQWKLALSLGGISVVTYLVWRGGLEGLYDAYRAATGNVRPGDIQARIPAVGGVGRSLAEVPPPPS